MTDFMGAPRPRPAVPTGGAGFETLTTITIVGLVGSALYVGREIFIPIAIAILLSFVLAPLVRRLRKWQVSRGLSVFIVVAVAFVVIFGLGAVLTRQMTQLASDLPRYETTIVNKIASVRGAAASSHIFSGASKALRTFGAQLTRATKNAEPQAAAPAPNAVNPIPVEVHQPPPGSLDILMSVAAPVLEPLATAGIVLVFVIFILLQREDLRDRLIRLAGSRDLQRTTAAIDDAAHRLSRYLLAQTTINASFGLIVGVGLTIIGVPGALLWGILAMLMRFVPYIGPFVAALFPIGLAAAVDPGWSMALETAAIFVIGEPVIGQFIEPMVYGHSTGLSPIAVVISATVWTWLWGPVGLILATPLTVCLVVLGRHVDRLEFLDVLLGDAPPLSPVESFYQRMLAGHSSEAAEQAEKYLKTGTLAGYYDEIALPGLALAQSDVRRGFLDEERQGRLLETIEELVDNLSDHVDRAPEAPASNRDEEAPASLMAAPSPAKPVQQPARIPRESEVQDGWKSGIPVLCVAGRTPLDRAAGAMLVHLLETHGIAARAESGDILAPRRIARLDLEGVRLVCLSYLDAHLSPAHVRFAVRRLRRRLPNAVILAGFWMTQADAGRLRELVAEVNADACATTLMEAVEACLETSRSATEPDKTGQVGARVSA